MRRRTLAALGLLALAAVILPPAERARSADGARRPPDVVFLVMDDMRSDQLVHMPFVRSHLVRRGVTFTNGLATDPLCCPSRVSILRGQYAHTTGIYTNNPPAGGYDGFHRAGLESSTLATWLDAAGYHTGLVGKYLNHYGPNNHAVPPGWDRWVGLDEAEQAVYDYDLNIDGRIVHRGSAPDDYAATVYADNAAGFIHSTPTSDPLFLYVGWNAPHAPFVPAPEHVGDPACDAVSRLDLPSFNEADVADKPFVISHLPAIPPDEAAWLGTTLPRTQCAMLRSVDDGVRRIFGALEATGRLERTLIVFISDNGLHGGEHRLVSGKQEPYEEDVRVPFVVRYDPITGGARGVERRLAANVDLAPTVADLVGLDATPGCPTPPYGDVCSGGFDGQSLLPLLDGSATSWRTEVLLEAIDWCAVRTERYKLVHRGSGEQELYDLVEDPYELSNLLSGPASDDVVALRDALETRLRDLCSPVPPWFSFDTAFPPPAPWIAGVSPTHATNGTVVTLTGVNLRTAVSVTFGGVPSPFTVLPPGRVRASVPAGATAGPITATTAGGTASIPFVIDPPVITSVEPGAGAPGDRVEITGLGLASVTEVAFNGTVSEHEEPSATSIVATVPLGASDGPITVTAPTGTGASPEPFHILANDVHVVDHAFSPPSLTTPIGRYVVWRFDGPASHSVADASMLGPSSTPLFDSGLQPAGAEYAVRFVASGTYPYRSRGAEPAPMRGAIKVRPAISPLDDDARTFTVTWATDEIAGLVFDVSYRVRPRGSRWRAWHPWFSGTTRLDAPFAPSQRPATYQFRARIRNDESGAVSGYSPKGIVSIR